MKNVFQRVSMLLIVYFFLFLFFAPSTLLLYADCPRDTDWDWTEDTPQDFYMHDGQNFTNVRLPYFDYFGPASVLNMGAETDIYPEDGWVLMFKDFGTPECTVATPLFVLYNRFRGIIRLFYYNALTDHTYSYAVGELGQPSGYQAAALFTFGRTSYFLDSFDEGAKESSVHKLGPNQWSYVDYAVIGYDSNLDMDATLYFEVSAIRTGEIEIDGDVSLDQVLDDQGNISGNVNPFNAIAGGYSWFVGADKARERLKKIRDNNSTAWFSSVLTSITSQSVANIALPLSGLVGLLEGFIFGKKESVKPLKFKGDLDLSGAITETHYLFSFEIRIPGAPLSDPNDSKRPFYNEPLGIFNLETLPILNFSWEVECPNEGLPGRGPKIPDDQGGTCDTFTMVNSDGPIAIAINPAILDRAEVKIGVVPPYQETVYHGLANYRLSTGYQGEYFYPVGIALRARIRTDNPDEPYATIVQSFVASPWRTY